MNGIYALGENVQLHLILQFEYGDGLSIIKLTENKTTDAYTIVKVNVYKTRSKLVNISISFAFFDPNTYVPILTSSNKNKFLKLLQGSKHCLLLEKVVDPALRSIKTTNKDIAFYFVQ